MTTPNYGWPYPDQDDEADGAGQLETLALAADADLKALADEVALLDGGGGGGTVVGGRWSAGSTAQLIDATVSGLGTPVAFGSVGALIAPTGVTRSTQGVGHKFVLGSAGLWHCAATLRVANNSAAGEISAGIWCDPDGGTDYEDFNIAHDGARREGLARTMNPADSTYLPSGAAIVVHLYNGTGGQRTLEPNNGKWVHLDLWRVS